MKPISQPMRTALYAASLDKGKHFHPFTWQRTINALEQRGLAEPCPWPCPCVWWRLTDAGWTYIGDLPLGAS